MSPREKYGNEAGAATGDRAREIPNQVFYGVATADGEGMLYGTTGPIEGATNGVEKVYVARRSASSGRWVSKSALPPGVGANASNYIGQQPAFLYPSPLLDTTVFTALGSFVQENPVTGTGNHSAAVNLADESGSVQWLTRPSGVITPVPKPGEIGRGEMAPAGGAPTGTIFLTYSGLLLPEDESRRPHVEGNVGEGPWGFYEWKAGVLKNAGELPDKTYDPFGAVPAAQLAHITTFYPDDFNNATSRDGSWALFVSPDPESEHPTSDPVELYLRKGGRTTLLSADTLHGTPAPGYEDPELKRFGFSTGVTPMYPLDACHSFCPAFAYAASDGTRAFFESRDKLAHSAEGQEPEGEGPWMYEANLAGATPKLVYLPGVSGTILAASEDGSRFIFDRVIPESTGLPVELDLWSGTRVIQIASLSPLGHSEIAPVRSTPDGSAFVFESNLELPGGFNNGGEYDQVYRYEVASETLTCLSCPPKGVAPTGNAHLSNDDGQLFANEAVGTQEDANLTLSVGSRGISGDGKAVFFDTPEALVPQDVNKQRDVYEAREGQLYLISSGRSARASYLLDNSTSGHDVFFATADGLTGGDVDESYDVYDARVGGGFAPPAVSPAPCTTDCQSGAWLPPTPASVVSAMSGPSGNFAASGGKHGNAKRKSAKRHRRKHRGRRHKPKRPMAGTRMRGAPR